MSKVSLLVTQGGADTYTAGTVSTGITLDGKSGWSITGMEAFWVDGAAVAAADWSLYAVVGTLPTATTFGSADEVGRLAWGMQNTAGVAVSLMYEPIKQGFLVEPRITVQPDIYCQVTSSNTAQANDVIFVIYYDVVKLTDLEVMRLYAGGA